MKIINLLFWKQKKGISPVGEWQAVDTETREILDSGVMYDHGTHWDTEPVKKEGKVILLYSGGLDSFLAWEYLKRPKTIYFDLGHRYALHELIAIRKTIPDTIINKSLHLGQWEKEDADIPMRNAFMIMMASMYDKDIVLVVQKGEMSIPDRTPQFFMSFGGWLNWMKYEHGHSLSSPFFDMTKTEMVKWYVEQGLSIDQLVKTRSCFSGATSACGACGACFRRWVALRNNNIMEVHTNNMLDWDQIPVYIEKMKAGKYDELRTEETFRALREAGYDL